MTTPSEITWTDPTTNVDGSPVTSGEVTGYEVGVRMADGAAGIYPFGAKAPATAVSELIASIPNLPVGVLLSAAVRTNTAGLDVNGNPVNSAWSNEAQFTLPVPAPIPNPPSQVSVQ